MFCGFIFLVIRLQVQQKQSKLCERNFLTATLKFEKSKQKRLSNQSKERVFALYSTLSRKSNNCSGVGMFLYSEHFCKIKACN
jgi:hypothetical protein